MEFKKYFLDKAEIVPLNGYVKGINFIFNFIAAWWLYIKKNTQVEIIRNQIERILARVRYATELVIK